MKTPILDTVNTIKDLRKLTLDKLVDLAQELRTFIVEVISSKEGHLGASLGTVELTIALHYVFNTPSDILVWDVGHQAYGHKILTGRKHLFYTNRQYEGISGFLRREESPFDTFGAGHSSTSISAALGMAVTASLEGNYQRQHLAVIGDASIVSGMSFEALNHAGDTDANICVVLNDNAMGIDPSVGALKHYFIKSRKAKNKFVEALNFQDFGVVDGHNIEALIDVFNKIKTSDIGPKFLHVTTVKGKGLRKAEENQVVYHAPGKFDKKTGVLQKKTEDSLPKYQDIFGFTILELARKNKKIIGITPAMPTGSSLKHMMEVYPNRAFDVGIAEQHSVTFAAGMATQGFIPFCVLYSTFAQRAYDQYYPRCSFAKIIRNFLYRPAGIVGHDGATHHGFFDLVFFRSIPNMIVFAPKDAIELRNIMYTAQKGLSQPIMIRYPRGNITKPIATDVTFQTLEIGKGRKLKSGSKLAVLSVGTIAENVIQAISQLKKPSLVAHYDMRFVKPLDDNLLHKIFAKYKAVVTVEDGIKTGGFGSAVAEFATTNNYTTKLVRLGIPDTFIEHGSVEQLHSLCSIDAYSIANTLSDL